MSATKVSPTGTGTTTPRSVRSVLDVVMLVGLFLVVVADGVAQGLEGAIIPPVLVLQALYLLCGSSWRLAGAGPCSCHWWSARWASWRTSPRGFRSIP